MRVTCPHCGRDIECGIHNEYRDPHSVGLPEKIYRCPHCENFFHPPTFPSNSTFVGAVSGATLGTAIAGVAGAFFGGVIGAILGSQAGDKK